MKINKKYIVLLVIMISFTFMPKVFGHRPVSKTKACHSNLRVFEGALEMYCEDNNIRITDVEPRNWDIIEDKLVKERYLKTNLQRLCDDCFYGMTSKYSPYPEGDPKREGYAYCTHHGSPHEECKDYYQICTSMEYYDPPSRREQLDREFNIYMTCVIVSIIIGIIVEIAKRKSKTTLKNKS